MSLTPELRSEREQLNKELMALANRVQRYIDKIQPDEEYTDRVVADAVLVIGTKAYNSVEETMFGSVYTFVGDDATVGYVGHGLLADALDYYKSTGDL